MKRNKTICSLKRIISATKYDILFQFRHGFYYAYIIISFFYILMLRNIPEIAQRKVATAILFTDTSILGFFFIGGIILLEKRQNTIESIFVTPLRNLEYFISKILSLSLIALSMSILIVTVGLGKIPQNLFLVVLGVMFNSVLFTILGMIFASKAKSMNNFFLTSFLFCSIFTLPIFDFLNLFHTKLFYILPTHTGLFMLNSLSENITAFSIVLGIIVNIIWITLCFFWLNLRFNKYVIQRIGD